MSNNFITGNYWKHHFSRLDWRILSTIIYGPYFIARGRDLSTNKICQIFDLYQNGKLSQFRRIPKKSVFIQFFSVDADKEIINGTSATRQTNRLVDHLNLLQNRCRNKHLCIIHGVYASLRWWAVGNNRKSSWTIVLSAFYPIR